MATAFRRKGRSAIYIKYIGPTRHQTPPIATTAKNKAEARALALEIEHKGGQQRNGLERLSAETLVAGLSVAVSSTPPSSTGTVSPGTTPAT